MNPNENSVLCPSCGELCSEDAKFCAQCRSPITSYASTGPYESIFAEGAAYRSAFNSPTKPIVVVGVWLLFGPLVLGGLGMLGEAVSSGSFSRFPNLNASDLSLLVMGVGLLFLGGYILYKTTSNFLKHRKSQS